MKSCFPDSNYAAGFGKQSVNCVFQVNAQCLLMSGFVGILVVRQLLIADDLHLSCLQTIKRIRGLEHFTCNSLIHFFEVDTFC